MNNYFSTNLKYLTKLLRVSQEQLALQAKVRSTTISNWMNEKTEPDVSQVVDICHFFGISMDVFCLQNFGDGKLITEEYVQDFKENGKGNGKLIGKPMPKKPTNYEPANSGLSTVNEKDETLLFAVLSTLKQMDGKLDQLQASVDDPKKKKA